MSDYRFGFMPRQSSLAFAGWQVAPLDRFEDVKQWMVKHAHKDGFLYPPLGHSQTADGEVVPHSHRPVHLHRVPASHSLSTEYERRTSKNDRTGAAMVIHLLGFWHGTWLQFGDWWFDARIPLSTNSLNESNKAAEHFLTHAVDAWRKWPDEARKRFVNILFMFNRAPSYEWDWEHFAVEYMVLDALYRMAIDLQLMPRVKRHMERIDGMCQHLRVPENSTMSKELVRLRNDLLHETLWDKGQPGSAGSGAAFMCQFHLRRLNLRLVPAILDYRNDFVRTNWWTLGPYAFGLPSHAEG